MLAGYLAWFCWTYEQIRFRNTLLEWDSFVCRGLLLHTRYLLLTLYGLLKKHSSGSSSSSDLNYRCHRHCGGCLIHASFKCRKLQVKHAYRASTFPGDRILHSGHSLDLLWSKTGCHRQFGKILAAKAGTQQKTKQERMAS